MSPAGESNKIKGFAIEADGLVKTFNGHRALDGITFKVKRGSVHGFLGPNGAGKTTAIKILLGLIRADEGRVRILGEPLYFGRKLYYLQYTNYLPQLPVFPAGLTGKETLSLVAEIYKIDRGKSRPRILRLLEFFQLADAANRRVDAYSRGMQQRLGLAAVLLTEPELLILDEPVSALDPDGRRMVLEMIGKLKGRATVFFSSHILADVERVCDHVTIIDRGQKLLDADTGELLRRFVMEQYLLTVKAEDRLRAKALLERNPLLRQVTPHLNQFLVIARPGAADQVAESLLPDLISQGITVTEFMPNRTNLEEIFFKALAEKRHREKMQ